MPDGFLSEKLLRMGKWDEQMLAPLVLTINLSVANYSETTMAATRATRGCCKVESCYCVHEKKRNAAAAAAEFLSVREF
jgi:hypothetical protein